ncbi:hypothetical protein C1645_821867 [Glomus cerebriforme]|uniref:Uncharacterized protein n=1 Tax=Glomus cerebriforme TaxID=658196 RepID=A0A397T9A7_9GLOM|nr:hypothetical protein C1645_821867 [Glomus cerebriforme]
MDEGELYDDYSEKIIHIIPNSDFIEKKYVPASEEISKVLYNYYAKNAKEIIVNIIQNFTRTAGGSLAGKHFKMMAHDILQKGGDFKDVTIFQKLIILSLSIYCASSI